MFDPIITIPKTTVEMVITIGATLFLFQGIYQLNNLFKKKEY